MKTSKYLRQYNEKKWNTFMTSPFFENYRKQILALAEEKMAQTPPYVRFTELNMFAETGDRKVFEKVMAQYDVRIRTYFLAYLMTEDEKYLPHLADVLWSYCDFETWSLQAHCNVEDSKNRRELIDLNTAVIGPEMAELVFVIGDKLPERLVRRIHYELRDRVIDAYKKHPERGYRRTCNNWASVIAAGIFRTYLFECEREEIDEVLPSLREMIDHYLSGFDDEGCCMEGYGYWTYGFTHFCIFADLLRAYTDGKEDLFLDPKVRAIAHFQENATLDNVHTMPFSDCNPNFRPSMSLTHFLKREYADLCVPVMPAPTYTQCGLRLLMWMDPDISSDGIVQKSHVFSENQWFIFKGPRYHFATKGGCNAEFHNHHDVGSFVISKNDKLTFTDPGGGKYTRQYFSSERYTLIETASRGHSVPIINGKGQVWEEKRATVLKQTENEYAFTMAQVYREPTLLRLDRAFDAQADRLTLTDTYEFTLTPQSVVERFICSDAPTLADSGRVVCGESTLVYSPDVFDVTISSEPHSGDAGGEIHFVDLTVKHPQAQMVLSVDFI